ncbi:hypothetical protein QF023_003069 [Chryseobacterium sp. SLBN-27]|uniref:hypothetical protein n=1 Tax=Chryseobacterium sp. SLBN-27 TaxID=3042287 RepID=UPI002859DC8B|nr:hypothetical protein [Chryseobacterium sp. SLBN-27]MDR6159553.1 hypothetical protein [Chryseobacterium sp. SLBN-27]
MKKSFLLLLLTLAFHFFSAQTVTFISEKTNKPLPKVSVFGKDGSIVAYSDIDGKIDKNLIKPDQEKFQLVYDNFSVATLSYADFEKEIIKVDDKIRNIEPVVIKNNKPAKYVFVKGNFNAYVTVNNKLNCYADGIVTYIFDNKTKKLKATNVEQYRIYRLEDAVFEKKQTGMWDYQTLLKLPEMKEVGNILEYKKKNSVIKELKGQQKDQIEITGEALQEKEFAFFGYRFYDVKNIINAAYEKDSQKTLRDLLEFNEIGFLKLKHKSEPEYNQLIIYKNFYPIELDFQDENISEKNKFDLKNSSYTTKFWENQDFPNMQSVFSSYFGDKLKEKQNIK